MIWQRAKFGVRKKSKTGSKSEWWICNYRTPNNFILCLDSYSNQILAKMCKNTKKEIWTSYLVRWHPEAGRNTQHTSSFYLLQDFAKLVGSPFKFQNKKCATSKNLKCDLLPRIFSITNILGPIFSVIFYIIFKNVKLGNK